MVHVLIWTPVRGFFGVIKDYIYEKNVVNNTTGDTINYYKNNGLWHAYNMI